MKLYHGTEKVEIFLKHTWRYTHATFFGTPDLWLAEIYARHHGGKNGRLFEFDLEKPKKVVDFGGQNTYCHKFWWMIEKLGDEGVLSVLIKNVNDFPSNQFKHNLISDIVVVFDLKLVQLKYYKEILSS